MKERILKTKEKLSHVLPLAEKYRIKLALENHIDITSDDLDRLIDFDSPSIGICYDSGNFLAMDENPLDAFYRFKDRILCTHLKDVCPKERYPDAPSFGLPGKQVQFCALGEGILPIQEILAEILAAKGKDAYITLEIPTPVQSSLSQACLLQKEIDNVLKSMEYIRRIKPSLMDRKKGENSCPENSV